MLDMFVALFGKRCPQDLVRRALFLSTQSAIADGLLHRPEARYIPNLQGPGECGDGSYSGNRPEAFEPLGQQWIPLQRTHQSVFRFLTPYDRLPAQPQQRPDAFMNLCAI